MSASVFTVEEAQAAQITLVSGGKGSQAVHDVVTALRANRRSGTANTKTRSEVAGTGKKPWRQKGTGRARAGSVTSPIWRGGGVVFGPRPRDYSKAVNKSTRKLAFRAALGSRIAAGDVIIIPDFSITDGKTKSFVAAVKAVTDTEKVLIIAEAFTELTFRGARNVGSIRLITASEVNVEQMLNFKTIIIAQDALSTLARRTQK